MIRPEQWASLSETCAFIGNSLMLPMSQTARVGADPAFWEAFPDFGDENVRAAADVLAVWARRASAEGEQAAVDAASLEHTHLFVGPPKPAAAPWETFHRGSSEVSVGFGQATYEMRVLLREAGLELSGPSNQYEDHMGVEMLLLSEYCRHAARAYAGDACDMSATRMAVEVDAVDAPASAGFYDLVGETAAPSSHAGGATASLGGSVSDATTGADDPAVFATRVTSYLDEHPLAWVGRLSEAVEAEAPGGYVAGLLNLERAILTWMRARL